MCQEIEFTWKLLIFSYQVENDRFRLPFCAEIVSHSCFELQSPRLRKSQ